MIDTRLVKKAVEKSEIIEEIDSSWREHIRNLNDNIFTVPFKGEYEAVIKDSSMLIEGYSGSLLIDKIYYNRKTYLLREPVRHYPFKIYGVYDRQGYFRYFVTKPEMGFHYMGMSEEGYSVCTGEIEYTDPDSIDTLKSISEKIINSLRLINMDSLGTTLLPDAYSKLRDIFANKEIDSKTKFEKLVSEKLIEKIL